jgi:tetraspanin-11
MVECYGKGIKYSLLLANSIIFVSIARNSNSANNKLPTSSVSALLILSLFKLACVLPTIQLSGTVVLALGIWTVSDRSFMERLLGINLYVASAVLLIITGTIVAFISLLGSLGAYKEIKYMLKTYFVILLALLAVILTVGSLCFIFRQEVDDRLQKEMHNSMRLYGNDSQVTEAWDSMQINFECCGVTLKGLRGFETWRRENQRFNSTTDGPFVPASCCRSREDDQIKRNCQGRQPKKEDTYFDGCYDKMKTVIKSHTVAIMSVAIFAILFIIFGLVLSGTLYIIIGRKSAAKLSDTDSN